MASQLHILVADSHPSVRHLLREMLGASGLTVLTARDADEAASVLAQTTPRLLIVEYRLSGRGAFGLVEHLRSRGHDIPFVCLIEKGEEGLVADVMLQGACDFIVKDNTFTDIVPHVVQRALSELDRNDRLVHVERALVSTERKFKALLKAAPDAVVVSDSEGRIVVVNSEAERMFGYASREILGQTIGLLIPEREGRGNVSARAPQNLGSSGPSRVLTGVTKNGKAFPIEVSLGPVETEEGLLLFNAIRDVTERQRLEQELVHAQKMDAVGRLAGGIAHDFNNILAAILSFAGLAREDVRADDSVASDLDGIIASARRGATLVSQLLAFSRRQVTRLELCSLNDVIGNMQGMLRRVVGEHIHFRLHLKSPLPAVRVDQGQMEQILMNLVVNARDAMTNGGALTIATGEQELANGEAATGAAMPPGRYVTLTVTDTGRGIAPEDLGRVFDPFFTTKQSSGGTGLGLSTVYGIVQQSHGYIQVTSEPGKGARFAVFLPAQQGKPETVPRTLSTPQFSIGNGGTVLIVEDDPAVRALVVRTLTRHGFNVLEADGSAQALYIAERHREAIDLLLSDVVMPTMSGPELAQRLCRTRPETRVLFMTGYVDDTVLHHGLGSDGSLLIQKPFEPSGLVAKVRQILSDPAPRANGIGRDG